MSDEDVSVDFWLRNEIVKERRYLWKLVYIYFFCRKLI